VSSDRAWAERERLFRTFHHYGVNGYWGVSFGIAVFMVENGPANNMMGHDNMMANLEAYACPAIPKEDRRLAAATIAMNKALASYVMSDTLRRRDFWKYWAKFYHAGGPAREPVAREENNAGYAKLMEGIWRDRAVPWMKGHGLDKMRTYEVYLFKPHGDMTGTVWVCP